MRIVNCQRIFALRGTENHHSQTVKLGISPPTAWKLASEGTRAQKSATREMDRASFVLVLGVLVIHPYETTTSDAVFPERSVNHSIAPGADSSSIADLRPAVLTVISVTVGIFLTPCSLVSAAVILAMAPHSASFILSLLC